MKPRFFFTYFLLLLFSLQAFGKIYTVDNVPKVHLQNKYQYVSDPEHILSQSARDKMDALLYNLEMQTGVETAVIVVPSIGTADCFDFSHQLLNTWGVGKSGANNGLVILLVTDQRCVQFYTGYGLEGPLPDAICKRIQTVKMIPYLKDNDWDNGMVAGIEAVCQQLKDPEAVLPELKEPGFFESLDEDAIFVIGFLGVGLLFFLLIFLIILYSKKCPQCKKFKLKVTGRKVLHKSQTKLIEEITSTCSNCGYIRKRKMESSINNDSNHNGPYIGGGFGGSSSRGSSFGGGSYGGGSGGGGGAGSRF